MKKRESTTESKDHFERKPYEVRLPGFVNDKEVGLGDMIKRATYAVGIKPCGGCARRATALNRWVVFTGRPRSR